jgi:hypothetical protein
MDVRHPRCSKYPGGYIAASADGDLAKLRRAYGQMCLARNQDMAYNAYRASRGTGQLLPRKDWTTKVYKNMDEDWAKKARKKIEWTEEVRYGNRWIRWNKVRYH